MAQEMRLKPLVNAAFLPRWIGYLVRLPCEIVSKDEDTLKVKTTDSVEIQVNLIKGTEVEGRFALFTGRAINAKEIDMSTYVRLADDSGKVLSDSSADQATNLQYSDISSSNDAIEFYHDDRFSTATGYARPLVREPNDSSA
ncbi:hypothetical protein NP233_g3885 [Leucocoprinus birnbaumii]|uniref:Uncharacterized protein n=1 Tax=Leucocoprinus birnbaumii TaxID=56174 RepID=A0AAD5VYC8_9AGAR|nr:hypothetical protein NP233_g3885 [Leucocoprinus birnbaumii]